ncbi:hypothetical protein [Helicobacter pylori]|nr:hypothetical protein [Helicobacter pylori]
MRWSLNSVKSIKDTERETLPNTRKPIVFSVWVLQWSIGNQIDAF